MMNATNLSPHIYHDYSTEHITRLVSPPGQENSVDCFPLHLHMILSNPANRDIICWMSHGRSWKVNDMEMLRVIWEEQVGNLFCGFNRSVRAWGFKQIMNGRDREKYYHELFLRRRRDLCRFMTRQPCNNRTHISNQMDEPDFYMMIPLPLDPDPADNARDMEDEGEVNELHIGGVL